VFADLLLQPDYPLDPGSIEFLLEEALAGSQDAPVQVVCRILTDRQLSAAQQENLAQFVRRACSNRPAVKRSFDHSLRKFGRCPKKQRTWLHRQLAPGPSSSPKRATLGTSSVRGTTLDLVDVSGSIAEFPLVIDRIGALDRSASELHIALGRFTYASAISAIAQWILANHFESRYEFFRTTPEMERYLEDIGFSRALRNREIVIKPDPMDWAVGLTRINRDQPTERVTAKIVDILETFVNPGEGDRQALLVLISEMIENVHRHAETEVDGFAVAQVYPQKLKMGITLVDAGIGVRESFLRGDPSIPIDRSWTDERFLREAVKLHSTSKKVRHSGYGLYLLAELIRRNRGTFLLTSGRATLVGYQRSNALVFEAQAHRAWHGTIVSVIIDLTNDLPLLEIYREMPAPEGYEEEDLFVE